MTTPQIIEVREEQGVAVLRLPAQVTLGGGANELQECVKELLVADKTRILINAEQVTTIDSSGAGALMRCFASVRSAEGELKLLKLSERFQEVLRLSRLLQVLEVYNEEEAALASFK